MIEQRETWESRQRLRLVLAVLAQGYCIAVPHRGTVQVFIPSRQRSRVYRPFFIWIPVGPVEDTRAEPAICGKTHSTGVPHPTPPRSQVPAAAQSRQQCRYTVPPAAYSAWLPVALGLPPECHGAPHLQLHFSGPCMRRTRFSTPRAEETFCQLPERRIKTTRGMT